LQVSVTSVMTELVVAVLSRPPERPEPQPSGPDQLQRQQRRGGMPIDQDEAAGQHEQAASSRTPVTRPRAG